MKKGHYPRLTAQQRAYAMETLLGKHPYEAARISGVAFPKVQYASMEHSTGVQAVIGLARMQREKKLDILVNQLQIIVEKDAEGEFKWSDKIRAMELQAKLVGLLGTEGQKGTVNFNFFDIKDATPQQLWQRLQQIKEQRALQTESIDAQVVETEQKEAE